MATRALFRAFTSHNAPISDSLGVWKGSLLGAKIHTTAANEADKSLTDFMKDMGGSFKDERKGIAGGFLQQQNTGAYRRDPREVESHRNSKFVNFIQGAMVEDKRQFQRLRNTAEADIVHIKLLKNNTFVTITDSKGNKKAGASSGCVEELKGGGRNSRFSSDTTAEHVGRLAKTLGIKSVIMRVSGFTHFKKKKQAILSWKDGYSFGRDQNPIQYIEDTTRRAHNGCRLPKKRRV